jgi:hypothetical protein
LDESELTDAQRAVVDFCKKCFERDKNDFVEGLIWNDHFWKTKEDRGFLRDISWSLAEDPHHQMDVPNLWNAQEQHHLEKHPSYFEDDDMVRVPYENTVEGQLAQLSSAVDKLREALGSQSLEDLADQQRAHFEQVIEQTRGQIRGLSRELSDRADELARAISEGSLSRRFDRLEDRIKRQNLVLWMLVIAAGAYLYFSA